MCVEIDYYRENASVQIVRQQTMDYYKVSKSIPSFIHNQESVGNWMCCETLCAAADAPHSTAQQRAYSPSRFFFIRQ